LSILVQIKHSVIVKWSSGLEKWTGFRDHVLVEVIQEARDLVDIDFSSENGIQVKFVARKFFYIDFN